MCYRKKAEIFLNSIISRVNHLQIAHFHAEKEFPLFLEITQCLHFEKNDLKSRFLIESQM